MRMPAHDLHAGTGARRTLVYLLLIATIVALAWPYLGIDGGRAAAQTQASDAGYLPDDCGKWSSSTTETGSNRQALQLSVDSGSGNSLANTYMYPCVSGVRWELKANVVGLTSYNSNMYAYVTGVYAPNAPTITYAAGNQSEQWYHVMFGNLFFCSSNTSPCQGARTGITLATIKGTPSTAPTSNYTLSITPAGAFTIGGSGVYTDLWTTAGSAMNVWASDIPAGTLGCAIGGTTVYSGGLFGPYTCTAQISAFSNLSWLLGGSSFHINALDLVFSYLVTHKQDPTDPYDPAQAPGTNSIQLPNTTISVN